MKKIVFLALLLLLTFTVSVFAVDSDGGVEISFCVGDSILLINGEKVDVEKPYVVGAGVTLVPVRVITESFGAVVGWEDETQKVTLTYKDKVIVIYIGNDEAVINGEKVKMLAAPELTLSGFTMVPLRFISENFGAEVGYDEATEAISVVKAPEVNVNAGMTYFEKEGLFSIQVPEKYLFSDVESSDNSFAFIKEPPLRYRTYTRDKVDVYQFSTEILDDVVQALESDREIQKNLIDRKKYSVTDVNSLNVNSMIFWYYDILDRENDNYIVARKTMFNIGKKTFLTVDGVGDSTENAADDYSGEKLSFIFYDNLTLNIPEIFSKEPVNFSAKIPVRSEILPRITVAFYKTSSEEEARGFIEREHAKLVETRNSKFVKISDISDAVYGENNGFEFTAEYLSDNSGATHIVFDCGGYLAYLEMSYGNGDKKEKFALAAECFKALVKEADIEKMLPATEKTEKTKVQIGDMLFELPYGFDSYISEDKMYACVYSRDNNLLITVYGNTAVIDNEDLEFRSETTNYIPGYGLKTALVLKKKMTNCDILHKTATEYGRIGWDTDVLGNNDGENYRYGYDYAELSQWISSQTDIHKKICYYYTNVDGSDRTYSAYAEQREENLKNKTVTQQNLNVFVFTYTDIFDNENINAVIDEIMLSAKRAD